MHEIYDSIKYCMKIFPYEKQKEIFNIINSIDCTNLLKIGNVPLIILSTPPCQLQTNRHREKTKYYQEKNKFQYFVCC